MFWRHAQMLQHVLSVLLRERLVRHDVLVERNPITLSFSSFLELRNI